MQADANELVRKLNYCYGKWQAVNDQMQDLLVRVEDLELRAAIKHIQSERKEAFRALEEAIGMLNGRRAA